MHFRLKVHSDALGVSVLRIEASSPEDAVCQARVQGWMAFSVEAEGGGVRHFMARLRRRKERRFSLLMFSQQLLALLEAGLNLVEAVETLAEKEASAPMKAVLRQLLDQLYAGQACSAAMQTVPDAFPPFFVATIRASERSGDMAESLRRFVTYQGQIEGVRKKVVSAMIYPLLLLAAGGLVTFFLLGYVVPKFSRIYEDRAGDLPLLSKLLMRFGGLIARHGPEFGGALALAVALLVALCMQAPVRQWARRRLWAMPGLGERLRLYQLARFYRTVGMLLRGGTPVVAALELVPGLLSPALRTQLARAVTSIREGQGIAESLHGSALTTSVSYRMLRVGEQSGRMGDMMERVAAFHDDEISLWIDVFTKVFEPLLMALIGALVGAIVILMYLPILDLAGSIQ